VAGCGCSGQGAPHTAGGGANGAGRRLAAGGSGESGPLAARECCGGQQHIVGDAWPPGAGHSSSQWCLAAGCHTGGAASASRCCTGGTGGGPVTASCRCTCGRLLVPVRCSYTGGCGGHGARSRLALCMLLLIVRWPRCSTATGGHADVFPRAVPALQCCCGWSFISPLRTSAHVCRCHNTSGQHRRLDPFESCTSAASDGVDSELKQGPLTQAFLSTGGADLPNNGAGSTDDVMEGEDDIGDEAKMALPPPIHAAGGHAGTCQVCCTR